MQINTDYLHDATVFEIAIQIDHSGNRRLRVRMTCDTDCGCDELSNRNIDVLFDDPVIILAELFGHMANAEEFNSWNDVTSETMKRKLTRFTESGLPMPKHVVELVFHSGSVIEVACNDIQFAIG